MRRIWLVVGFLSLIGVAVIARRLVALAHPAAGELDAGFERHALLTVLHIVPALVFLVLGPVQFLRLRAHRWTGRVFFGAALMVGITALVMSPRMAIGGAKETAATTFFGIVFLFDLIKGFVHIRRREVALHREWMIRAYAIGLAVTTIRPIVGVFFATRGVTHLTPREFFGIAFWIGFTLHLIAAEAWIGHTRLKRHAAVDQQLGANCEA